MFCPKCGTNNPENSYYCKQCGYNFKAVNNYPEENQTYSNSVSKEVKEDKLGVGLIILCILLPIVGIVGFFIWKKETPNKAKNALIIALVAWVAWIILLGN